ncbi:MAG TPA: tetratricopeptide repeat protein [Prolixibacteraceae bacterium]|nr:tetratricopeptide repeat protein [Prolixibacteraceae bacterium]
MKTTFLYILFLMILAVTVNGQNERKYVRQGNKYYEAALQDTTRLDTVQFNKAEIEYRKALEKKPDDPKWNFNLANAIYKQNKFEESAEQFKKIADQATDKMEKSRALHNMGNSMLMNNKVDESIAAYKEALRNNPEDLETKYNLLYAMNLKKKQEQQKKEDQKKDQKDQKDQNKDQSKDQQKNPDQKKQDQQQQANQQQQQIKISKQNAEQMLQALENNEKKTQEKVKKIQALKARTKDVEKDW